MYNGLEATPLEPEVVHEYAMMKRLLLALAGATVLLVSIVVTVLDAPRLAAQSAPSVAVSGVTLDVASIKPNASGTPMSFLRVNSAGVFMGTNVTTRSLIQSAYGLHTMQIDGGPMWMDTDRFDVIAKPFVGVTPRDTPDFGTDAMQLMLRSLLAERFKLASHTEMKALPVFLLTKARSDGTLGPWIRPSTVDCEATARPTMPTPLPRVGELPCGVMGGVGRYAAGSRPIAALVRYVEGMVDRLVLDRTGLGGNFDLNLEFAPNQLPGGSAPSALAGAERPSIFVALQEQLGLKLEAATAPASVLVIDHVEQPTPN